MDYSDQWQYDEYNQAGSSYQDPSRAARHDKRSEKLTDYKNVSELIVKQLKITDKDIVLDMGAGTGAHAIEIAPKCKELHAVDISKPMLGILKEKAARRNINNIKIKEGGLLTYQPEIAFDKAISITVHHHLPDFWKMIALDRLSKMIKKNGLLYIKDVVFSFDLKDYKNCFNKMIDFLKENSGEDLANEGKIHIKEEYSTFDWVLDEMFEKTGFEIINKQKESEMFAVYICRKK